VARHVTLGGLMSLYSPRPPAPPLNTARPVITGNPVVGQTLIGQAGTWDGASSFTRLWDRDGAPLGTATFHICVPSDVGHMIGCAVTAHGPGGTSTASATPVGPVT
jgi:hypothetical protein